MKKLIGLIMVLTMMVNVSYNVWANNHNVQIGDYVILGTYKNQSLSWQVINVDMDGIMTLYSAKIVDYMVFDSAESGVSGEGSNDRLANGSNDYLDSNLFEWLNSTGLVVEYSTTKPSLNSVMTLEDFDGNLTTGIMGNEPGFLYGFTTKEKLVLETTSYTVGTPYLDGDYPLAEGTRLVIGQATRIKGHQLRGLQSNVFLLSLNEYVEYVKNNGFDTLKEGQDGADYYWLRTPDEQSQTLVATIDPSGDLFKTTASFAKTGVVPAIKVDVNTFPILKGDGSLSNPYELDLTYADFAPEDIPDELSTMVTKELESYKASWVNESVFLNIEKDVRDIEANIRGAEDPFYMKAVYKTLASSINLNLHRNFYLAPQLLNANLVVPVTFNDISQLKESEIEAIGKLSQLGVINGYKDGSFKPSNSVSRAEMAKMMTLLIQKEDRILTKSFDDVKYGDWYYNYVENAKAQNLIRGYGDGTYLPNKTVTRDELSVIASRVLRYQYGFKGVDSKEAINRLDNQSYIASWAQDDVGLLVERDLILESETYLGNKAATRLEVVMVLNRLLNLIYQ